jgi:hypothetical protein
MAKPGAHKDPAIRARIQERLDAGMTVREIARDLDYSTEWVRYLIRELRDSEKETA